MVVRMVRLGVVALILVLGIAKASAQEPTAERRVANAQGRNGEFFSGLLAFLVENIFFGGIETMPFVASWVPVLVSGSVTKCHKVVGWVEHCDQLRDKAIGFNKFGPRKSLTHERTGLIWSSREWTEREK